MIEGLLSWLQLLNQSATVEARSVNNIIFIIYLLSFKRSWRFAMAFLLCTFAANTGFGGVFNSLSVPLYDLSYYVTICFIWCVTVKSQINHTTNKSLALSCIIMISFLLVMAWDSYYNAETETFIYSNYEAIILSIHICIILSLYDVATAVSNLVSKLRSNGSMLRLFNFN